MGDFKRLNHKILGSKTSKATPESSYWRNLSVPVFLKEFGAIDYIDFSPNEPYYFSVTSSVRVQLYSPVTRLLHKNLSRFQKNAYGGTFRNDGKLICAGGEEALVKLFDVSSKTLLRVFSGHNGPVHRCFFTYDNTQIVSFSDDKSVILWDIPSEKKILSFSEHSDYIRAGAVSPISADVILSGGYDGYVKMYDKRSENVVFTLNHGSPIESVIFLKSGGILLSAGGTEIKVWDAFSGGRLLARLHNHHKTVTCMCLASNGSKFMSGSLDRHVNIYDVATFQRVHTLDYPNSVLSVGISANDETIAVGMVDGLVSVSRRETEEKVTNFEKKQKKFKYGCDTKSESADIVVEDVKTMRLSRYDTYLKKFEFTKALKVVLAPYITNKFPRITVALLRELMYRKKLHAAVAGNEMKIVVPLLRFMIKYLGDYRFTNILIQVMHVFLDVYEDNITECGPTAVTLFHRFQERVVEEVDVTQSMLSLEGCIDLLKFASNTDNSKCSPPIPAFLKQSESARDFIVNVS